ncbi:acetate/propionate family kinase [Massilia sp. 9096]|uniref:acetate/propionate family kinase n=1 Tax=Massilia sp. 9096 TaxID=1500894 RepID=UPI00056574FA|nr:acetate/propionate family kinase [Massilia sp. 9096]
MKPAYVALNAGSSSIKFSIYVADGDALLLRSHGAIEDLGEAPRFLACDAGGGVLHQQAFAAGADHAAVLGMLLGWIDAHLGPDRLAAVGHRVVHGGNLFAGPVCVDDGVVERLARLAPLAPLHQPHNLAAIRAIAALHPALPQVACFDTAFHLGNPPVSRMYALPRALQGEGVMRYGFHGLSYEYIAGELPRYLPDGADRVVVAHLGNGASMCALSKGRSIASSMGFSALDGLPMGTRSGSIDPAVVLYLVQEKGLSPEAVSHLLYHESGLLGVSGISHDVRTLLHSAEPRAAQALDLMVYRVGRELGSLAFALQGLDAIVFTAGIGEHATQMRKRICEGAAWLSVRLDDVANEAGNACITRPDSEVSAWVIPTNEEIVIARHTRRLACRVRAGTGQPIT